MSYLKGVISVHNFFIHPVELSMSSICADEKRNFLFTSSVMSQLSVRM